MYRYIFNRNFVIINFVTTTNIRENHLHTKLYKYRNDPTLVSFLGPKLKGQDTELVKGGTYVPLCQLQL